MNKAVVKSTLRILVTASSLFGVISRIAIQIPGTSRMEALLYFTIQSNLMVCIFLLIDIAAGRRSHTAANEKKKMELANSPIWHAVHGAILLYISMTGLIYNILLASDMNAFGFNAVILFINHTVTPILFFLFWLIRQRHYVYSAKLIAPWLIYPIIYFIFSSIRGAATGEFRYPFLDFTTQNASRYAAGLAMVTAFFVLAAWIIISVNKRTRHSNPSDSE